MQGKLEWVEVMIVSVYVTELGHLVAQAFEFPHGSRLGFSLLGLAFSSLVLTYTMLRPDHHRPWKWAGSLLAILLAALFALFIVFNYE